VQNGKSAIGTDAKNLHKNLEVIEALVQVSVCCARVVVIYLNSAIANTNLIGHHDQGAFLLSGGNGAGCGNES